MKDRVSALERAFQIAQSGDVANMKMLRGSLKGEGHNYDKIQGPSLTRQLQDAMKAARTGRGEATITMVARRVAPLLEDD